MKRTNKVASFLRIKEWHTSKVTMMIGILSFFIFQNKECIQVFYQRIAIYYIFLFVFLATSYIVNDITDIEADKKAGKKKVVAQMPIQVSLGIVCLLIMMGNVPLILFVEQKRLALLIIVITYFFGFAYSFPGIRFKEKGILGLIECSFAQRCLPLLLVICMEKLNRIQLLLLIVWIVISFCNGLRYILIHQIIDAENDRNSGIVTFVSAKSGNYRNVIVKLFYVEIFLSVIATFPVLVEGSVLCVIILVAYIYLEYCIYKVLNDYAKKDWFITFDSVPLEAYYNIIMPLMIGLCMLRLSLWIIPYCVMLAILCYKPLLVKLMIAKIYMNSK